MLEAAWQPIVDILHHIRLMVFGNFDVIYNGSVVLTLIACSYHIYQNIKKSVVFIINLCSGTGGAGDTQGTGFGCHTVSLNHPCRVSVSPHVGKARLRQVAYDSVAV